MAGVLGMGETIMLKARQIMAWNIAAGLLAFAPAHATSESVIYDFAGGTGGTPGVGGLSSLNGTLYGALNKYGSSGAIYSLTPSGIFSVLYSFRGGADGNYPNSPLTYLNGVFYGTTAAGGGTGCGGIGCGTVYSLTPAGVEAIVYAFQGGADGAEPLAGLTAIGTTLYGITTGGGMVCTSEFKGGCGTVFSVTPSGTETVLHRFAFGTDGANPGQQANLLDVGGTLYGTTSAGGNGCTTKLGCGIIFSISLTGQEQVLHAFTSGTDGYGPNSGLTLVGNTLYGGTGSGGAHKNGTVYKITTSGTESVIYAVKDGPSGGGILSNLLNVNGVLYGQFEQGGAKGDHANGNGAVFSITPAGTEKLVYSFKGGATDGANPATALTQINGVLYGTTYFGGPSCGETADGCGVVYQITP